MLPTVRSSRPKMFCKQGVLRNSTKFTKKHLCQSLIFNKVAGLRPQTCNFIKKEALAQEFSCEFCKTSKNTFFRKTPLVAASAYCIVVISCYLIVSIVSNCFFMSNNKSLTFTVKIFSKLSIWFQRKGIIDLVCKQGNNFKVSEIKSTFLAQFWDYMKDC